MLHAHVSFIYHRRSMILATNSVAKQSICVNVLRTVFFPPMDLRAGEQSEWQQQLNTGKMIHEFNML